MNCPHGHSTFEPCFAGTCRQKIFKHERGRTVRVVKLLCDSCGMGTGIRGGRGRRGLTARTLREWQLTHPAPTHDTHWKLVAVDSGQEILGHGAVPIVLTSELQ